MKYHLVERDYRAALAEIAEFQPLAPDVESRLYFEQLRLMSLGLLGELGEEIVDASPLSNDAGLRAWLVRRFL